MKTKLLKKVRKRYVVTYYPREIKLFDSIYRGQCMVLWDRKEDHRLTGVEIGIKYDNFFELRAATKEEARRILMDKIISWVKRDYPYAYKRKKQNVELIWYSEK